MKPDFAKDFIQACAEIPTLPKDKQGYGYKFTDFDTVISTIKPILARHNIGFMQCAETIDGVTYIKTIVIHSSGETMESSIKLPEIAMAKTNNAQNLGAAITYMKRYSLCAIFGASADEDIDAATIQPQQPQFVAQNRQQQQGRQVPQSQPQAQKPVQPTAPAQKVSNQPYENENLSAEQIDALLKDADKIAYSFKKELSATYLVTKDGKQWTHFDFLQKIVKDKEYQKAHLATLIAIEALFKAAPKEANLLGQSINLYPTITMAEYENIKNKINATRNGN